MGDTTPRLGLPFLFSGQAQKEVTHNEALQRLDLWVQAVVIDTLPTPPEYPQLGDCWLVGTDAIGPWDGQAGSLAQWTAGGWRFAAPVDGVAVWHQAMGVTLRHLGGNWTGAISATAVRIGGEQVIGARQPAIPAPTGGANADAECRASVAAILTALQAHGLISN